MINVEFDFEKLNKNEKQIYERMTDSERANFEKLWIQMEMQKVRMQQQINRSKERYQREKTALAKKERNERTHRLIERGAILEQFIPSELDNEKIVKILVSCVGSDYGRRMIESVMRQQYDGEDN